METLVLGWYIMVETGSVLLLTVLASLQYVGTLIAPVLGMVGGKGQSLRELHATPPLLWRGSLVVGR